MKVKESCIVFDMDDTLTQTSYWIAEQLYARWEKEGRDDLIKIHRDHTQIEGQISLKHPEIYAHIYDLLGDPEFMLKLAPTRLFNKVFKEKTLYGLIKNKRVIVATHRGFHAEGKAFTEQWLTQHRAMEKIETVHCLDSKVHPNKVAYLTEHYGNDFLLIDDNPLHDLTAEHPENRRIIIYNEYGDYPAYRNQNFLIF